MPLWMGKVSNNSGVFEPLKLLPSHGSQSWSTWIADKQKSSLQFSWSYQRCWKILIRWVSFSNTHPTRTAILSAIKNYRNLSTSFLNLRQSHSRTPLDQLLHLWWRIFRCLQWILCLYSIPIHLNINQSALSEGVQNILLFIPLEK